MRLEVAFVQEPPVFLDLPGSVARAVALVRQAADLGAGLVVFPETWLPGYPVWLDAAPGSALWDHEPAAALFAHLYANAPTLDGPEVAALAEAAAACGVDVVLGMHERAGGTLYNATVMLGADGTSLARRKLTPTFNEKLIWGMGDGSTLGTWRRPWGTVGSLVCWEHWMPLARAAMHAQGETVHVAQWPAVGERHQLASRTYAFEGQCVVLAAGCVLSRDDVLEGFDRSGGPPVARELLEAIPGGALLKDGGSAVIGPDTSYLMAPAGDRRGLVRHGVDLDAVASMRMAIDVAGHYARPDVFELRVDMRPRPGTTFRSGS